MIVMVLAACLTGFRQLISVCRGLKRGIQAAGDGTLEASFTASGRTSVFENEFLDDCYRQYRSMVKEHPDTACDIRSFINEEAIETYVHRGILEMIPDVLTSLGILGTFVGLVVGLRSFDPSGYEQMAGSITPLINGIKVAFITSIYGISLSLAFSFNLRSEFSNLSTLTEEFLDTYYLHVRPPYEVDSLSRLLQNQKSRDEMTRDLTTVFVEQMSESFEKVITPAYNRMTEGINHVVDVFTESQAQVMTQVCETVVEQMRGEMQEDFARLGDTIQSLEKAQASYTDFVDRSVAQMQQTFRSMQDSFAQMDQYNTHSFDKLNEAQMEAFRINQEQKTAYQDYIRFMYQSIEQFSEVWEKNSQKLQQYSDEIGKMGPVRSNQEILDSLNNISQQLKDVQKRQISAEISADLNASNEEQAELLRKTIRKLDELTEIVDTPKLFRRRRK
jgi:hypothetical protein